VALAVADAAELGIPNAVPREVVDAVARPGRTAAG
jgi:hypothetical protein